MIPGGSHLLLDEFPAAVEALRTFLKADMNEAEAIVCDVQTTMKYVVRGEKATFHAGDRVEELLAGRRAPGDDPRRAADRATSSRSTATASCWSTSRPT